MRMCQAVGDPYSQPDDFFDVTRACGRSTQTGATRRASLRIQESSYVRRCQRAGVDLVENIATAVRHRRTLPEIRENVGERRHAEKRHAHRLKVTPFMDRINR